MLESSSILLKVTCTFCNSSFPTFSNCHIISTKMMIDTSIALNSLRPIIWPFTKWKGSSFLVCLSDVFVHNLVYQSNKSRVILLSVTKRTFKDVSSNPNRISFTAASLTFEQNLQFQEYCTQVLILPPCIYFCFHRFLNCMSEKYTARNN